MTFEQRDGSSDDKESACIAGDLVPSPGPEDPLEKEMTTHFSILAWEIPWTEEPGGLQSLHGVAKRVYLVTKQH